MKKRIYAKRCVKIAALCLAIIATLSLAQQYALAHFDGHKIRIEGFYEEQKNSLDVVFLGASDIYSGFLPGAAYDKYGFTSYLYATGANPISLYKSQLKEVLHNQSPKLVVVEINGALYNKDEKLYKEGNIRKYIDNIPFNQNKIDTIKDLVPADQQIEYFCPIIKYHGAWNDVTDVTKWIGGNVKIHQRGYSLLKGSSVCANVDGKVKSLKKNLENDNSTRDLLPESEQYLRDFLQYCKDEKLDNVVFVRYPHKVTKNMYERFQRTNTAENIINEYGYSLLNFEKNFNKTGLDYSKDFANCDHLNIYGQQKMTDYLSSILCSEYGLTKSDLSESQKEEWNNVSDYTKRYVKFVEQKTKEKTDKWYSEESDTMAELEKITL